MLDVCREYAEAYDILFKATKIKCMFLIEIGFSILNSDIKSNIIYIFCMDAVYGNLVHIM